MGKTKNNNDIDQVLFYRSYGEIFIRADNVVSDELIKTMSKFVFYGIEPEISELSSTTAMLWLSMKPTLERSIQKSRTNSQNGAKGGAPKGNQNARKKDKENGKGKGKGIRREKTTEKQAKNNRKTSEKQAVVFSENSLSILEYFNSKTGGQYQLNQDNADLLDELFESGYTVENIKHVIDVKCSEWLNDSKMEKQLVPWVVFKKENFERYVQQPKTNQEIKQILNINRIENAKEKREKLIEKLNVVDQEYNSTSEADKDKRFELRNRKKELEAQIESLNRKIASN